MALMASLKDPPKRRPIDPPKSPREAEEAFNSHRPAVGVTTGSGKEAERPPDGSGEGSQRSREAADPHKGKKTSAGDSSAAFTEKSLDFLALMMISMKEMQKRMNDSKDDAGLVKGVETIRAGSPDLPALQPWEAQHGPLILGDWLLLTEPMVADLSMMAGEWWRITVKAAEEWYKLHMSLSPLERIKHPCEAPPEITLEKWQRVERRVSSMILQAVPQGVREQLVASRRMTTFGIVTYLLVAYSPGGVSEKQNILRSLEEPPEIQSLNEAPGALRRWLRWRNRAKEIGAVPPDPALQLKGLLKMSKKQLESQRELQFRVSLVRSGLGPWG